MNLDGLFNVTISRLLSVNIVQSLLSVAESVSASAVLRDTTRHIESVYEYLEHITSPIHFEFTQLQTTLLIVFLAIIGVNVLLIGYYWSKYGGVITDRFIRPSEAETRISIIYLFFVLFLLFCSVCCDAVNSLLRRKTTCCLY